MQIRIWSLAIACIALYACASPQKAGHTAAVTPAVTPAVQPSDLPYDARIAEAAKRAKEMGYHVETRHGVQFYCRTVAPLGSRLTEKECLTVDTMIQTARMAEENQAAQRQGQLCQGAGCVIK